MISWLFLKSLKIRRVRYTQCWSEHSLAFCVQSNGWCMNYEYYFCPRHFSPTSFCIFQSLSFDCLVKNIPITSFNVSCLTIQIPTPHTVEGGDCENTLSGWCSVVKILPLTKFGTLKIQGHLRTYLRKVPATIINT